MTDPQPTDPLRGPWQAVIVDGDGYALTIDQALSPDRPAREIVVVRGQAVPGPPDADGRRHVPDSEDPWSWPDTLYCIELPWQPDGVHTETLHRWAQAQAAAALFNLANGRSVDELLDDRHLIEMGPDGWTMQHPLICRMSGHLFDCRFNRAAARITRVVQLPPGLYEAVFSPTSSYLKVVPPTGDDEIVWIAAGRADIEHHALADWQLSSISRVTECGRSTRTGHVVRLADVATQHRTRPCAGCYPDTGR